MDCIRAFVQFLPLLCQDLPTGLFVLISIHASFNSNIHHPTSHTQISSLVVLQALKYQVSVELLQFSSSVIHFCRSHFRPMYVILSLEVAIPAAKDI